VSRENLDLVRELNAEPGVGADMKAFVANEELVRMMWEGYFHADAAWVLAEDDHTGLAGEYHGPDEFRRGLGEYLEAWETYLWIPERFIGADDVVVVLARERGRSATAGVEMDHEAATVWWIRDGRVARVEAYQHHDKALRAAARE
jgi:ketosteroid isomerase-like protein